MDERRPEQDRGYDEKNRAIEEKELEKHEEKYHEKTEEKTFEEKRRQDPVGSLVWAATLIWAGVVLLVNNLGYLDGWRIRLGDTSVNMPFDVETWFGAWQLFFLGAGVLVLIGVISRLLIPEYRRPVLGSLIWAIVLFGVAMGEWNLIWPLILVAVGVSLLLGSAIRRR